MLGKTPQQPQFRASVLPIDGQAAQVFQQPVQRADALGSFVRWQAGDGRPIAAGQPVEGGGIRRLGEKRNVPERIEQKSGAPCITAVSP